MRKEINDIFSCELKMSSVATVFDRCHGEKSKHKNVAVRVYSKYFTV